MKSESWREHIERELDELISQTILKLPNQKLMRRLSFRYRDYLVEYKYYIDNAGFVRPCIQILKKVPLRDYPCWSRAYKYHCSDDKYALVLNFIDGSPFYVLEYVYPRPLRGIRKVLEKLYEYLASN